MKMSKLGVEPQDKIEFKYITNPPKIPLIFVPSTYHENIGVFVVSVRHFAQNESCSETFDEVSSDSTVLIAKGNIQLALLQLLNTLLLLRCQLNTIKP